MNGTSGNKFAGSGFTSVPRDYICGGFHETSKAATLHSQNTSTSLKTDRVSATVALVQSSSPNFSLS
jgi:hypothetical protein